MSKTSQLHHTELERCYATINELRGVAKLAVEAIRILAGKELLERPATQTVIRTIEEALERTAP